MIGKNWFLRWTKTGFEIQKNYCQVRQKNKNLFWKCQKETVLKWTKVVLGLAKTGFKIDIICFEFTKTDFEIDKLKLDLTSAKERFGVEKKDSKISKNWF